MASITNIQIKFTYIAQEDRLGGHNRRNCLCALNPKRKRTNSSFSFATIVDGRCGVYSGQGEIVKIMVHCQFSYITLKMFGFPPYRFMTHTKNRGFCPFLD